MAGTGNVKTKQKRSKLTLDRLFSIKKYITETFSVLAKHDKSPSQIERNNTVPKGTGKTVYKKVAVSDKCEDGSCHMPRSTTLSDQCADQTNNPACYLEEVSYVQNTQNLLQRIQTWPHDEYSTHELEDQFSNENQNRFHLPVFDRPNTESVTGHWHNQCSVGQNSSTQTHNVPSVRNQAIQTDMNDELDINADIIRYLSQFNDKIAFSVYAPTVLRQCANGYPYYYEQDYCLYNNSHGHTHRRHTRRAEEYIQLPTRDHYAQDAIYRPPYDPPPCLGYRESKRQYGLGVCSDQRRQQTLERVAPNTSDFAWTKNNNILAHSRLDTKVSSEDSGSILSSETDSDFMFYPCSSLTHNLQCMTMVDSRSSNFLSPPSDLPENISTHFSWRTGFYGSSLDEVTLQFFLDEDALSDDVFLDENELISPADMAADKDRRTDNETTQQSASLYSRMYDISPQSDQDNPGGDVVFRDSYGDNCYAYRYADIDEVLNNYNCTVQKYEIDETSGREYSPEPVESGYIPVSNNPETHCSLADSHLEFSDEFSNVLDSLRRNSTQTKARKMWRQRRAKAKKNSTFNSDNKKENTPVCQPAFFTFDHINMQNHNTNFPTKPLRGILKKKEYASSKRLEPESNQQQENCHSSYDIRGECPTIFTLDMNSRPPPGSPCVYASVHKRLNHTITLSSVDEVGEVTTALDQTKDNSQPETNSVDTESTISTYSSNNGDINAETTNVQLHAPEDQQTKKSPLSNYNSDDFHVILSSDSDGRRKIIALRKNSLETYEWTRSLQRRHRKMVRKGKCCQNCTQSGECQIARHQNGLTSSI